MMNDNIEKIILNAKYISAGTSLADNAPIKIFKLETLEKDIFEIANVAPLAANQKLSLKLVLNTVDELKVLSGEAFRNRALCLVGQVEIFINELNADS